MSTVMHQEIHLFSLKYLSFLLLASILRREQNISRPIGDDPFALDGFGDCKFQDFFYEKMHYFLFDSCCTCFRYWYWW